MKRPRFATSSCPAVSSFARDLCHVETVIHLRRPIVIPPPTGPTSLSILS
ncbi:hypothetical protein CCACVL1_18816 [Corchorus capsularis]|uniref:Uncharacterized protein n=1 Tax=Corchorus capsularis TaxID=210143 RepID=A0A1R3HJP0_COCAP|nr:hypothetical protein CCACVL1_18816 [Corchorus capsularis]